MKKYKNKDQKKLAEFIKRHLELMQTCFALTHYDIKVKWKPKLEDTMKIHIHINYLDAKLLWGNDLLKFWRDKNTEMVLQCIAHELIHIPIAPLTDEMCCKKVTEVVKHFEENAVEHCSRLAYRLYVYWLKEKGLKI